MSENLDIRCKIGHATNDHQQASKSDRTGLGRETGRLQITEVHHGTDIQFAAIGVKALGTSEGALS